MTRSAPPTKAASARRKTRAASAPSQPAPMKFLVSEENGGGYYWTIVADGGETLVRSASFASCEEAKQAARIVHAGASSASFENRSGDAPLIDLRARRGHVSARDASDAERWLEGASEPSGPSASPNG